MDLYVLGCYIGHVYAVHLPSSAEAATTPAATAAATTPAADGAKNQYNHTPTLSYPRSPSGRVLQNGFSLTSTKSSTQLNRVFTRPDKE